MKRFSFLYILVLSVCLAACSTADKNMIASLQFDNQQLEARLQSLRDQNQDMKEANRKLNGELTEAELKLAGLEKEKSRLASRERDLLTQLEERDEVAEEKDSLLSARDELAQKLENELADYKAKLEMTERGLVISFIAEILFKSGRADVLTEAFPILDKVNETLKTSAIKSKVAVEGHTDNVPIKHSNWKSNWELSAARALSVLHYFVDQKGLAPSRISAIAFGEYQPRESNETSEGRRQNRRVEIVILPELKKK